MMYSLRLIFNISLETSWCPPTFENGCVCIDGANVDNIDVTIGFHFYKAAIIWMVHQMELFHLTSPLRTGFRTKTRNNDEVSQTSSITSLKALKNTPLPPKSVRIKIFFTGSYCRRLTRSADNDDIWSSRPRWLGFRLTWEPDSPLGILNLLSFLYHRRPRSVLTIRTGKSESGQSDIFRVKSVAAAWRGGRRRIMNLMNSRPCWIHDLTSQ